MDMLIGLLIGFFGAFILIHFIAKHAKAIHEQKLDEQLEKGLEKLKETIIPSRIEISNGTLYLYNRENNEFIAQGTTFEELNVNAKKRYPEKLFNVPQPEIDLIKGVL